MLPYDPAVRRYHDPTKSTKPYLYLFDDDDELWMYVGWKNKSPAVRSNYSSTYHTKRTKPYRYRLQIK